MATLIGRTAGGKAIFTLKDGEFIGGQEDREQFDFYVEQGASPEQAAERIVGSYGELVEE